MGFYFHRVLYVFALKLPIPLKNLHWTFRMESCHVPPITCIHSGQIILLRIEAELGFVVEEFFYDILVFFWLDATGAVYQTPSGFQHDSACF